MNNYDIMAEQARLRFLTYDQETICRRLSLSPTPEIIPLRFLGRDYRICRRDGRICDSTGKGADCNTVMSIYDVLCRSEAVPHLSGQFVPTAALSGIHGTGPVHEDLNAHAAAFFSGRAEQLKAVCLRLGGELWGKGDVSCILPVFDFFPLRLCFWDADEDFPASLQFFWDANALDFLHYETLWYVTGALISQLKAEMEQ